MKPDKVDSLLFLGPSSSCIQSFLFQSAFYLAEQGFKILFISTHPLDKLPASFKGLGNPGSEIMKLIRFMYLTTNEALLDYLYSIHTYAEIPQVIIIDKLENYALIEENQKNSEPYKCEMHSALLCASLLNAMSVCASKTQGRVLLMASIEDVDHSLLKLNSISDLFFTDMIYLFSNENEQIFIENISGQSKGIKLQFKNDSVNNKIIFKKILEYLQQ